MSVIRNIGYQKYQISEILSIRNTVKSCDIPGKFPCFRETSFYDLRPFAVFSEMMKTINKDKVHRNNSMHPNKLPQLQLYLRI